MMLLNQLKERLPPTTFELLKGKLRHAKRLLIGLIMCIAQEYGNIIQTANFLTEPPARRDFLEASYKRPPQLISNPEALYLPSGVNDEQMDRHAFSTELFANPQIIRPNHFHPETDENKEGYHLMNPLVSMNYKEIHIMINT